MSESGDGYIMEMPPQKWRQKEGGVLGSWLVADCSKFLAVLLELAFDGTEGLSHGHMYRRVILRHGYRVAFDVQFNSGSVEFAFVFVFVRTVQRNAAMKDGGAVAVQLLKFLVDDVVQSGGSVKISVYNVRVWLHR